MTKADMLAQALDDFLAVSPDVEAAAVVSADGLPMASALPPYVEEDRLAAMSAALLTLGERAAAGLGKGDLAQVFVEGTQGYVVLMSAGSNAVLVAVTSKDSKVGLVLYEMRKTAARIANVMDEPVSADQQAAVAMDRAATAITAAPEPAAAPAEPATDSAQPEQSWQEEEPFQVAEPQDTQWQEAEAAPAAQPWGPTEDEIATESWTEVASPPAPPAPEPVAEETTPDTGWENEKVPDDQTKVTGWH